MRENRSSVWTMLVAACLAGSGCSVALGTRPTAEARIVAPSESCRPGGLNVSARPLAPDEVAELAELETASADLEHFTGGYYYAPSYYGSPAEDFLYALLGIAALAGMIIFLDNNAEEVHFHSDTVDIHITD